MEASAVDKDEAKDFSLQYFACMPSWQRPIRTTTGDRPWIPATSFLSSSYTWKHIDYETSEGFIDLANPLQVEDANEIRQADKIKSKKKKVEKIKDFKVTEEGLTDMDSAMLSDSGDDSENYLDEYGNLIEPTDNVSDCPSDSPNTKKEGKSKKKKNRAKKKKLDWNWKDHDSVVDEKNEQQDGMAKKEHQQNVPKEKPSLTSMGKLQVLQPEEPRPSFLNTSEQRLYLKLLHKFQRRDNLADLSTAEKEEYRIFQGFQTLVREEQEEFQDFAKEIYQHQMAAAGTFYLKPQVRRYIEEYYEYRLQRVQHYPRIFEICKTLNDSALRLVPKTNEQQQKPQFKMTVEMTLVEVGTIPKIMLPQMKTLKEYTPRVPNSYEKLNGKIPTNPDFTKLGQPVDRSKELYKTLISEDSNAKRLAMLYLPEIVISASALKVIFDNSGPMYDHEWDIPFSVRLYDTAEGRNCLEKGKVIFIDKPLPSKSLSACDKNQLYHKIASKAFLLHPWTRSVPHHSTKEETTPTPCRVDDLRVFEADDPFDTIDRDLTNLETFGVKSDNLNKVSILQVDGNDSESSEETKYIALQSKSKRTRKKIEVPPTTRLTRNQTQMISRKSAPDTSFSVTEQGGSCSTASSTKIPHELTGDTTLDSSFSVTEQDGPSRTTSATEISCELNEKDSSPCKLFIKDEGNCSFSVNEVLCSTSAEVTSSSSKDMGFETQKTQDKQDNATGNILDKIILAQSTLLQKESRAVIQSESKYSQNWWLGEKVEIFDKSLNPKDFLFPQDDANISYRVWNLSNKDSTKGSIRILIRSSTHGLRRDKNGTFQTFTVGSKLEHQTAFGAEQLNRSELARDWIATMIRPESKLARLRIDAKNHNILMCEEKSLKDLTRDGHKVDFNPAEQLGNLHTLFLSLLQDVKEPGQYLMRHDSKSGAFVRVFKAVPEGKEHKPAGGDTYDLHVAYNAARACEERVATVSWHPIDVSIITPWHYATSKVPGLFRASSYRGRGRGGRRGANRDAKY